VSLAAKLVKLAVFIVVAWSSLTGEPASSGFRVGFKVEATCRAELSLEVAKSVDEGAAMSKSADFSALRKVGNSILNVVISTGARVPGWGEMTTSATGRQRPTGS
jgi:hypothetical protein